MPGPIRGVIRTMLLASVVIPAKNEAGVIARALESLARQVDREGHLLDPDCFEILLLVNNSTDNTAEVARQFRREHPSMRLEITERSYAPAQANIGHVRRELMEEASGRLGRGVILSTDADTEVAADWIAQNLHEIAQGVDAVGGLIRLDLAGRSRLPVRIQKMQRLDNRYRTLVAWLEDQYDPLAYDPWPRHYHHFGSSLAVTVEAYRAVGGLPPEHKLEDVEFYNALIRNDRKFRHSVAVKIRTSARLEGRTAIGLAEQLQRWGSDEHAGEGTPVDSVRFMELLFRSRRSFRELWNERGDFAKRTPVEEALGYAHFGEAWDALGMDAKLRELLGPAESRAPIGQVTAELEALFAGWAAAQANSFSITDPGDSAPGAANDGWSIPVLKEVFRDVIASERSTGQGAAPVHE